MLGRFQGSSGQVGRPRGLQMKILGAAQVRGDGGFWAYATTQGEHFCLLTLSVLRSDDYVLRGTPYRLWTPQL